LSYTKDLKRLNSLLFASIKIEYFDGEYFSCQNYLTSLKDNQNFCNGRSDERITFYFEKSEGSKCADIVRKVIRRLINKFCITSCLQAKVKSQATTFHE